MLGQTLDATSLKMRYFFEARRERVFSAWTQADALKAWFKVAPDFRTTLAEIDLRVNGRYRLGMQAPGSEQAQIATGEYWVVEPPSKLVFTWRWEGSDEAETLVTLEFLESGQGTELILTHEKFANIQARELHTQGWTGCLGQLDVFLRHKEV